MPERAIEPLSDSVVGLLAESLADTDCGGPGKDYCCSYHEGFADGAAAGLVVRSDDVR